MKTKTLIKLIVCKFFLLSFLVGMAQPKPEKTFDHEKFAKKVYGNFSAGMDQGIFLPDDKALEFISAKTGKKIEDLKAEREQNKKYISEDKLTLQKENAGGKMVMGVELVKVDHPQLTMGNIIINAQGIKIVFGNCIQTDITWVLGDYMCIQGSVPVRKKEITKEEMAASYIALNEKDYSALKAQQWMFWSVIKSEGSAQVMKSGVQIEKNDYYNLDFTLDEGNKCRGEYKKGTATLRTWDTYLLDQSGNSITFTAKDGTKEKFDVNSISLKKLVLSNTVGGVKYYYVASKYVESTEEPVAITSTGSGKQKLIDNTPLGPNDGSTLTNASLFDKPMKGFYIDKDGKKISAVIKYQAPEMMNSANSALLLYKTAYNEPGFKEDESNNFIAAKLKMEVLAFSVNGHVYVPIEGEKWGILMKEGAIRECVYIFKTQTGSGKTGYQQSVWYKKHEGKTLPGLNLALGFKNSMSDFVSDNSELAEKIKNKEEGYTMLKTNFIIEEYNKWYDEKNPGKLKYIYAE